MTYRRVTADDLEHLPFDKGCLGETQFRDLAAQANRDMANNYYVLRVPSGMAIAWCNDCESLWDAQVVLEAGSRVSASELDEILGREG